MYFLRIIGASLISFTVIIMGFMKSNRYKINLQFLNELIEMIEYYKNSVRFTKNDVATVLNEYKNQNIRLIDESEINVDNLELKNDFLSEIGKTDTYGQIELCEFSLNKIKTKKERVEIEYLDKSKMFKNLSVLVGAAVFIILL